MSEKINLDALIPREDLAIDNNDPKGRRKDTISAVDLQSDAFFLLNLNKPDFQRETNEWELKKVCDFIKSFLTDELIPAIILWQSKSGNIFVIDGAHRLSSLIAWINDDYGDGNITRKHFGKNITDDQLFLANKMRAIIEREIGPYKRFTDALKSPETYDDTTVRAARNLSSLAIQLQWVEGDVSSAERSFFNINQKASPIDKTEMKLIENRRNPIGIASRAIMSGGSGHKYWSAFTEENQKELEDVAKEIHDILFLPKLQTPIKTVDVPICGKHNKDALPTIFDFIDLCNQNQQVYAKDSDGELTIRCLKQARKIARLINNKHESSLGLHPLIYFYSESGAFKVASFYAFALFVRDLDQKNKKDIFTKHRESFEEIYLQSANIIQYLVRKARGAKKSAPAVNEFLNEILIFLDKGTARDFFMTELRKKPKYSDVPDMMGAFIEEPSSDFTTATKSEIFIRSTIKSISKCSICNGYLHVNAISFDHIQRKQDGGDGSANNGQLSHPYCNTGYKN